MADLRALLEQLRLDREWGSHVTSWRTLGSRPAQHGEIPEGLDPRLIQVLADSGIEALYTHQSLAVQHALAGDNVVVVTPAASGKTLCYNLPVLDHLLSTPDACALYLFPTKALAHDQLNTLRGYVAGLGLDAVVSAYDGDTPRDRRARIRDSARVLISNPDMLHASLLPQHVRWRGLLAKLSYVVIDEMHAYRGIFGSHVANVLRRLRRLCHFYGSHPRFICCSATIANPGELARKLVEEPFVVVSRDGAPQGTRTVVFYNPPIVNEQLGLRLSPLQEARSLANTLLDHGLQLVIFGGSRMTVEQLVIYLRHDARVAGRDPGVIRGYRGGYLPQERREIEKGLRDGTVRAVAATNALELGVDIGGLSCCVMVGYPGTIASTWQQMGRAGRGLAPSVAVLLAASSPLDQYMISHPDYFFGRSHEHALIDPDNVYVLLNHLRCALSELPFDDGERYGAEDIPSALRFLEEEGEVRRSRGKWYWIGQDYPARDCSLRTAESDSVAILAVQHGADRRTVGQLDRASAAQWVHEGAIYLHEGQQYLVGSLDWDAGIAMVEPVSLDYYTEASQNTRVDIEHVATEQQGHNMCLALGEVKLTSSVSGYKRIRLGTGEHLGWGTVDLPERFMLTSACWMTVPEHVVARLRDEGWWVGEHVESRGPNWPRQRDAARRRDGYRCRQCGAEERPGLQHNVHHVVPFREFNWVPGENQNYRQANQIANLITLCPSCHRQIEQQVAVQSTLSGLGRVLRHLLPLFLMCDPRDVGMLSDVKAPQTGLPTLFIYDRIPGGVGLSDEAFSQYLDLLDMAAELITDCPCEFGCPSCIGPGAERTNRPKQQVSQLLAALRQ